MSDFSIKLDDRLPLLRSNLSDDDGYMDISNATVKFIYQTRNRSIVPTTGSATIVGAASGFVEYAWATGDVVTPGVYYGEWRVTTASGKHITFPNDSYFCFEIVNRLT